MKVCLISPPKPEKNATLQSYVPPLGSLSLAACLEKEGHQIYIIDCVIEDMSYHVLKEKIKKILPDIVGVSFVTQTRHSGFKCAEIAKEVSQEIITVVGGPHVSFLDKEILEQYSYVDIVVRGEGEKTLIELLKYSDRKDVNGIPYRKDGEIIRNPDRKSVENLDYLPFPAYHLIPVEIYSRQLRKSNSQFLKAPALPVGASRGCTMNCMFCSCKAMWGNIRTHSPQYVSENIFF